ncbi:MAG: AlwI family type II restriction endonuclease [Parabacteroides sp.]|nr:AlwI family type II restriction endonuclease [Parabacteroides sp.]
MAILRSRPLQSKTLFFATSPRTPFKIIPEIELLSEELSGEEWNPDTQVKFYNLLKERDFFEGAEAKDKAFAARDRINRVPKGLGFITMPIIGLSDVDREFLESKNKEEILLRQLLKFQIPSPYHPLGKKATNYNVKPYLELFRLIRELGELRFDELQIFGMQLVNYSLFDTIISKIRKFRTDKEAFSGRYKEFKDKVFYNEAYSIYEEEIITNNLHTRESKTETVEDFIAKKISNLRDYADACVRNLRSSGLIKVTSIGRTLSIIPERIKDVDYFLSTIDRKPVYVKELEQYQSYLWNPSLPVLLTDDRDSIIDKLHSEYSIKINPSLSLNKLKDLLNEQIDKRQQEKIEEQITKLKDYELYNDIEDTFNTLNSTYEPSLFFEWNTWRAMTMLDGGDIKANLKFDDEGNPMNTALGNMADIICDYGDFDVTVEATMATGALQWKMEGEPVPRHIGQNIERTNKPTYCLFIASKINPATIAHFYTLYLTNVAMYGGKCRIIPLELNTFRNMLGAAFKADSKPNPSDIKRLFDVAAKTAKECVINDATEIDWYNKITDYANNWLSA